MSHTLSTHFEPSKLVLKAYLVILKVSVTHTYVNKNKLKSSQNTFG